MEKKLKLPPKKSRFCWKGLRNDDFYMMTAESEVRRLIRNCKLTKDSTILDIGCGQGRLAYGLISLMPDIKKYIGIDVHKRSINWCKTAIGDEYKNFNFIHIDKANPRYNQKGSDIKSGFRLPFEDETFDVINLYSVFTHMKLETIKIYLREIFRVLKKGGHVFMTIFVHPRKKERIINDRKPFYRAYYDVDIIDRHIKKLGFKVDQFYFNTEIREQSVYYLLKEKI